jgi:phosphoribosylformimino-5-aminoimidazole carboxamide ribotide isomerase
MHILPVLDLMKGQVVRGIAGQRESYRPVESVLTSSTKPLEVAQAFHSQLGLAQFYVADLDAIQHQTPQVSLLIKLAERFPGLWLDAGLRNESDIPSVLESQDITFIAGLETLDGPQVLSELSKRFGPERIVFSLDLKRGVPMGDLTRWRGSTPWDLAREAIDAGLEKLIVLDLAQVGVGGGVSTLSLCQRIKGEFPFINIITGGGVRNAADLAQLKQAGIDGVLIASALHDGSIGQTDLKHLTVG